MSTQENVQTVRIIFQQWAAAISEDCWRFLPKTLWIIPGEWPLAGRGFAF
jgi:hypothetical protein